MNPVLPKKPGGWYGDKVISTRIDNKPTYRPTASITRLPNRLSMVLEALKNL